MSKRARGAPDASPLFPNLVLLHRISGQTSKIFHEHFVCEDLPLSIQDCSARLLACPGDTTLVVNAALTSKGHARALGVSLVELSALIDSRRLLIVTQTWVSHCLSLCRDGVAADVALAANEPDGIMEDPPPPRAIGPDVAGGGAGGPAAARAPAAPPESPSPFTLAAIEFAASRGIAPLPLHGCARVGWHLAADPASRSSQRRPPPPRFIGSAYPFFPGRFFLGAAAIDQMISRHPPARAIEVLWGTPAGVGVQLPAAFFDAPEGGGEPPPTMQHGAWLVVVWRDLRRAFVWHGWHTVEWYICNHDGRLLPSAATLCETVLQGGKRALVLVPEAVDTEWVRAAQECEAGVCTCAPRWQGHKKTGSCPSCSGCGCAARHGSRAGDFAPKRWCSVYEAKKRHSWPTFRADARSLLEAARALCAWPGGDGDDPLIALLRTWYDLAA